VINFIPQFDRANAWVGFVVLLLIMGCGSLPVSSRERSATKETSTDSTRNPDPAVSLNKIYLAYKKAYSKLGIAPDLDELVGIYLPEHGDPKLILQGIGLRDQFSNPKGENLDVIMAWTVNGPDDKYHVLFQSGRIDTLTSHELSTRGAGGKGAETDKAKREAGLIAQQKAAQNEERKIQEEATRHDDEERWKKKDLGEADKDYVRLRDSIRNKPETKKLMSAEDEWKVRRAKVIESARKNGLITVQKNFGHDKYIGNAPLPSVEEVLTAIRNGSEIPVTSGDKPN
jgi:hypothetical protein